MVLLSLAHLMPLIRPVVCVGRTTAPAFALLTSPLCLDLLETLVNSAVGYQKTQWIDGVRR